MMIATRNPPGDEKRSRIRAQPRLARTDGKQAKPKISATERWLLISKKVYGRAQQRAFVGGDPFEDLAQAIKEIDDEYVTDVSGLLALTDQAELVDQFRNLFAGFGLEKRSLDELLAMHREALEKLAEYNRELVNGAAERAVNRAALLRDATDEAMGALLSMARTASKFREGAHHYVHGQPTEAAIANVLSHLSTLAGSLGSLVENGQSARNEEAPGTRQQMDIHGGVVKAYDGMTPAELAKAPIAALKGISQATGERFKSAFGIASIREMSNSDLFERAEGIVTLANAEKSSVHGGELSGSRGPLTKRAEGPVRGLEGITPLQVAVLREALRVETIKDLAQNKFFRLARAIVVSADLES